MVKYSGYAIANDFFLTSDQKEVLERTAISADAEYHRVEEIRRNWGESHLYFYHRTDMISEKLDGFNLSKFKRSVIWPAFYGGKVRIVFKLKQGGVLPLSLSAEWVENQGWENPKVEGFSEPNWDIRYNIIGKKLKNYRGKKILAFFQRMQGGEFDPLIKDIFKNLYGTYREDDPMRVSMMIVLDIETISKGGDFA